MDRFGSTHLWFKNTRFGNWRGRSGGRRLGNYGGRSWCHRLGCLFYWQSFGRDDLVCGFRGRRSGSNKLVRTRLKALNLENPFHSDKSADQNRHTDEEGEK